MAKKNNRTVYQNADQKWVNKLNGATRASSLHDRQSDAAKKATKQLEKASGGELTIKGVDGKIRSKDTIAPGNDPNPPKDTEN